MDMGSVGSRRKIGLAVSLERCEVKKDSIGPRGRRKTEVAPAERLLFSCTDI